MGSKKTDPCTFCGELMWPTPDAAAVRACHPCRRKGLATKKSRSRPCAYPGCVNEVTSEDMGVRTCSRSCGQKLRTAEGRNHLASFSRPLVECPTCGTEFRAKMMKSQHGRSGYRQRFCSRPCSIPVRGEAWEWRSMLPTCSDCGRCTYRGRASRVCADCLERHKRENWARTTESRKKPPRPVVVIECQLCGLGVSTQYPDTLYCQPCRNSVRKGRHRSRARRYGVAYEPINPAEVYARDNWTCHICDDEIRRVPGNEVDIDGWSLDHIIPMSKGGPHLKWNVAASHWGCNVLKGDEFFAAA